MRQTHTHTARILGEVDEVRPEEDKQRCANFARGKNEGEIIFNNLPGLINYLRTLCVGANSNVWLVFTFDK